MSSETNTVSVAYTKLENGHGFKAADKTAKWLLVANHDLESAIAEVSQQLSEIFEGGKWHPTDETMQLLSGTDSEGGKASVLPLGSAVPMYWVNCEADAA